MLERRRQSTAAIVQRQLQNVQVSESVAGQKVTCLMLITIRIRHSHGFAEPEMQLGVLLALHRLLNDSNIRTVYTETSACICSSASKTGSIMHAGLHALSACILQ